MKWKFEILCWLAITIQLAVAVEDCFESGVKYTGNISTTVTGLICQRWDSQIPHNHTHDNNTEAVENYCRSINDDKPWCYTTDERIRWEYCAVPECVPILLSKDSSVDASAALGHSPVDTNFNDAQAMTDMYDCYEDGGDYRGNVSTTVSGLTCQRWDSQVPHNHTHDNDPEAIENYCRILADDKPWCYTTNVDVRWEYCSIKTCGELRAERMLNMLNADSSKDGASNIVLVNDADVATGGTGASNAVSGGTDTGVTGGSDTGLDAGLSGGTDAVLEAGLSGGTDTGLDTGVTGGTDAGLDTGLSGGSDTGLDAGVTGGTDTGLDTGVTGGPDTGLDAGVTGGTDAGLDTGVTGGTDAGLEAGLSGGSDTGLDAGVTGGTDTGLDTGVTGGPDTGLDAGVTGGTDAGLDTGVTGGTDAGLEAGLSGGTDAGLSGGTDAGLEAGLSGGTDAGVTDGTNIPFSGGADVDAGASPLVSEDLGGNGNASSDVSLTSGDAQSYGTTTSQLNGYATVETTQQTYTVTDANTNTLPLGDPETTTEKMKTDELSVDPTMVTKTNVNDKITTKGPGALYVMGTEETKTSPPATGNYEVHSVSSLNSISVADPVQTPETDLNPDVSIARLEYSSPVNEKVTIRCKVVPSDQLPIVWYKDGKLLENGGVTVRTGSILILNNIQVEDAGKYTCKAGNSEATTTLKILQDTYIPVDPPKTPEETQAATPDVTKSVTDSAKIDYVSTTSTSTLSSSTSYDMIKTETTTVPYVPDLQESSKRPEDLAKVTTPPETYVPEVPSSYSDSTSVKTDDVITTTQVPEVPKYEVDSSTVTVDDVKSTLTTPTETPYIPDVPDVSASASGSGTINVDVPKVPEVPGYVGDSSTVSVDDIKSTFTTPTETPYVPGVPDVPATGSGTINVDVPKVPEVPRYEGDSSTVAIDDVKSTSTIPTETPYIPDVPEVPATGPETVKIGVPKVPVVPRYEGDSSTVTVDDVKSTFTTPTETPYVPAVPDVSASDTSSGTIRTDVSGLPGYEGDSSPVKMDDVKTTLITPTESPYVPAIPDVSGPESASGPVNIVDVKSTPTTPTEPPYVPRVPVVPVSGTGSTVDDVIGTLSTPTDSPYVPAVPDVPGTETGSKITIDDIKSTAKPFVPGSDVDSSVITKDVTKSDQFPGTESLNPDDVINTLTPTDSRKDEVKYIKDTEPFAKEKTVSVRTDVKLGDVAKQDTLYRPANPSYVASSYSDGCASKCGDGGSCYVEYNCTHFEHCFEVDGSYCTCILRQCSFGTFWNSEIGNCDSVSNVFCKNDPCIDKPALSTYASGFNCRSFYQCNGLGRSMSMCCDEKYSYDPDSGDCVYDPTCDIGCTSRTPKYKKEPEVRPQVTESYNVCYFRAIINKPTKYFNDVFRIEQSCPPGTVYRSDICVCGDPINRDYEIPADAYFRRCVPRISINFSDDKVENKSPRKVYTEDEDVKITSSGSRRGVAYGTFNGRTSQISSARYDGVQLPKLLVRMRFYSDDRYGAPYQVLFSNCESTAKPWDIRELKPDENPSVAIILSKDEGRLTFLGYSEDKRVKPAIIRLDYSKKNWNNVELMYDGASFSARVRSVNPDGTIAENKDSKPLTGKLATSRQPIRIGKCSKSNAFYGFIDVIKMFDCIPN